MAEEIDEYTIDDLFKDLDDGYEEDTQQEPDTEITTEAVSKRINEVRAKTEAETRDSMAKELGYESYAALQKSKEKSLLQENGLDEEQIENVVNKLVENRLANDPRMAKLNEIEEKEKREFVTSQLEEINKLTGANYKDVSELSKDTLDLWEKTGNLKQAFLATEGENLLIKRNSEMSKGSTLHQVSSGNYPKSDKKTRKLTDEEKDIYRMVFRGEISDDELNSKHTNI